MALIADIYEKYELDVGESSAREDQVLSYDNNPYLHIEFDLVLNTYKLYNTYGTYVIDNYWWIWNKISGTTWTKVGWVVLMQKYVSATQFKYTFFIYFNGTTLYNSDSVNITNNNWHFVRVLCSAVRTGTNYSDLKGQLKIWDDPYLATVVKDSGFQSNSTAHTGLTDDWRVTTSYAIRFDQMNSGDYAHYFYGSFGAHVYSGAPSAIDSVTPFFLIDTRYNAGISLLSTITKLTNYSYKDVFALDYKLEMENLKDQNDALATQLTSTQSALSTALDNKESSIKGSSNKDLTNVFNQFAATVNSILGTSGPTTLTLQNSYLANATYGLSPIKTQVDAVISSWLDNPTFGLPILQPQISQVPGIATDVTQIKTQVAALFDLIVTKTQSTVNDFINTYGEYIMQLIEAKIADYNWQGRLGTLMVNIIKDMKVQPY